MTRVSALSGECLDALVWRATGGGAAAVERTLTANPGLADIATALPEGRQVEIPDITDTTGELPLVQLWD